MKGSKILVFGPLLSVQVASADIYNCDGRWTDKPCEAGEQSSVLKTEKQRKVLSPSEAEEMSRRQTIFHDLNMKAIEAQRRYDIRFSIDAVRSACLDRLKPIDECRKLAEDADEKISRRINQEQAIAAQREANDIERKKLAVEEQKAEAPATVIIERRSPYYRDRRFDRNYRDTWRNGRRYRDYYGGQNGGVQLNQQINIQQNTQPVVPPRATNPPAGSRMGVIR